MSFFLLLHKKKMSSVTSLLLFIAVCNKYAANAVSVLYASRMPQQISEFPADSKTMTPRLLQGKLANGNI